MSFCSPKILFHRKIPLAAVRKDDDDVLVDSDFPRDLLGGDKGGPAGDPSQNSFFLRHLFRPFERLLIADSHDLVDQGPIQDRRGKNPLPPPLLFTPPPPPPHSRAG